jgi:coenzyme F420-reducing hydrogenase delta subunit
MDVQSLICDLDQAGSASPYVTVFMCANCGRGSLSPELALRSRPDVPQFAWPFPAQEILVPCTGRIQPEHVLKAFESGARLVCAIACREDNCHYLEGSRRCARRVDYLRGLLDQVGLGAERLALFHLPGTAAEDTALAAGKPVPSFSRETVDAEVASIRATVVDILQTLAPTPLDSLVSEAAIDPYQEVDMSYDDGD